MSSRLVARQQDTTTRVIRTVVVPCELGLHLRVASRVVMSARRFQSEISFVLRGHQTDAKSVFGILQLGAVRGKRLALVAQGPDAEHAIQVLAELFGSHDTLCQEAVGEEVRGRADAHQ